MSCCKGNNGKRVKEKNSAATVQYAEQRDITVCWTQRLIDKWPLGGAVQSGSGEMLIRISTDDLWHAVTDWWKMQMKFDPGLNYLTTWPERRTKYEITDALFGIWLFVAYLCGLAVWWCAVHRSAHVKTFPRYLFTYKSQVYGPYSSGCVNQTLIEVIHCSTEDF